MKKFIVAAMLLLGACYSTSAQSIVREGNTFKSVTTKATKDTLVTAFKFEDSKGILYPIIINKANGRCWIWKKSSTPDKSGKTGKMYKMYMKPEVAKAICKDLGITYIETKKK